MADAIGLNCEIRKSREDKALRSQLEAGVWRVQVHGVDETWRVFCYLCTPTLFSSGSILTLRVADRLFAKFFGFLFDNMSWCYLVFSFLFPTLQTFILLLIMDKYGLR